MSLHDDIDKVTEMYDLRRDIILDEVPESLKKDLHEFIYGATLYNNKSGQKVLPFVDFIQWYKKLMSFGFGKLPKPNLVNIVVEKATNGCFTAYVPELLGCITYGASLEEVKENICEAINIQLEGMKEDGEAIPLNLQGEFAIELDLKTTSIKTMGEEGIKDLTCYKMFEVTHTPIEKIMFPETIVSIVFEWSTDILKDIEVLEKYYSREGIVEYLKNQYDWLNIGTKREIYFNSIGVKWKGITQQLGEIGMIKQHGNYGE